MSKTIALVSCVSEKLSSTVAAEQLYCSDWFMKASSYARQEADSWYILSAKYGLLRPDQVIEPYNQTLKSMPIHLRREWANGVIANLRNILEPGDKVIFLAGKIYRVLLIDPIINMGCQIEVPMEGLTIGRQLRWLNQYTGNTNE